MPERTYTSLVNRGIPEHIPELSEGDGDDPQFFYVDVCGRNDEFVGHFVRDADGTVALELPTAAQAEAVRFALNNPARMALMMRMCGYEFTNCGVREQIEPASPQTLQRLADEEAQRLERQRAFERERHT